MDETPVFRERLAIPTQADADAPSALMERRRALRLRSVERLYALLSQISRSIVRHPDRDGLLHEICRVAVEHGTFRMAWIGLPDATGGRVLPFSHAGNEHGCPEWFSAKSGNAPAELGLTGRALRTEHVEICEDIQADPNMPPWRAEALMRGYRSSAAVPFRERGAVVGVLNLYASEPDFFTAEERVLLEGLGENISYALDAIADRQALQEREGQLRFLNEHLADGMVYQIDSGRDGQLRRFSYLSQAVERLHGLTVDEIRRDPSALYGQVVEEHRAQVVEKEREAFVARKPLDVSVQVRLPSGELRWRRFLSAPATRADGNVVWNGIELDITERKRAEQLQARVERAESLELVGRLAGGVAHDFNNMLGVILGHAELALMAAGLPEEIRENLEDIRNATRRSADLTRQLLAFARKQPVEPAVLDLNAAVADMLKMIRRLIGEHIGLAWEPGPSRWTVRVDASQLDQLLANLCVNARDAIAGTGTITIGTDNAVLNEAFCENHAGVTPGEYVLLRVHDDGRGMSREILEHVFEPFFTTKVEGKGTGLGLATVYGIVRQNGGHIVAESAPGSGSTFTIYLPRFTGDVTSAGSAPDGAIPRGDGETILLVEDERAILRVAGEMLKQLGYQVIPAATPAEALLLAEAHHGGIRLLVTDVVMPGMNGQELARRIAATEPGLTTLFISGHFADVVSRNGVPEESARLLQKPFTRKALADAVHAALRDRPT